MRVPKFINFVAALLLVSAFAASASAQQATATGKVTLKQADGTEVPVQGAQVEFHRTDIKQTLKTKTDKKGEYVYAGLDLVGIYTILVSAPNATPSYSANIRIGRQPNNNFSLTPGDGRTMTLAEAQAGGVGVKPGAAPASGLTPEQAKKLDEENARLRAEVAAKNAKIEERNAKLPAIFKNANDAVTASNALKGAEKISKLDEAVNGYNQGLEIDPDEPAVYRNRQIALRARGLEKYNVAVVNKDKEAKNAGIEAARADLMNAVESGEKAIVAQRKRGQETTAGAGGTNGQKDEVGYMEDRAETYRRALQIKAPVDNDVAAKSIEEYINAETDAAKKEKMQSSLGDALFYAGRIDESLAKFRQILAQNPNNMEAMFGLGIALASTNPPQLAEARDALQQYASKAPDGNVRKLEAAEMVKYLDESLKAEANNKSQDANKSRTTGRRKP